MSRRVDGVSRPPRRPFFTFSLLIIVALVLTPVAMLVTASVTQSAAQSGAMTAVLSVLWGGAALMCGLRPLWDRDFAAEGGRWAHTRWFLRRHYGWAGVLAVAVVGVAAAVAYVIPREAARAAVTALAVYLAAAAVTALWRRWRAPRTAAGPRSVDSRA